MSTASSQYAFLVPLAAYPLPVHTKQDYDACRAAASAERNAAEPERPSLVNQSRNYRFEMYMQELVDRTGLESLRFLSGKVWAFCCPHDYDLEPTWACISADMVTELSGQTLLKTRDDVNRLIAWIVEHARACAQGEETDFVFDSFVYPEEFFENLSSISPEDDPKNKRFGEDGDSPECLLWVLRQFATVLGYAVRHDMRAFYETSGEPSRVQLIAKGYDVPPYLHLQVRLPSSGLEDSQQFAFSIDPEECSLAIQARHHYNLCAKAAAQSRQKNPADEAQRYLIGISHRFGFERLMEALITRTGMDDLCFLSGQSWEYRFPHEEDIPPENEYVAVDLVTRVSSSLRAIEQLLAWIDEHTRTCAREPGTDFVFAEWTTPEAFLKQLPQLAPTPMPHQQFDQDGDAPAYLYCLLQQLATVVRHANQHRMIVFYETWRELRREDL